MSDVVSVHRNVRRRLFFNLSTIRRTKEQAAQSGLFFCILFYKHSKKSDKKLLLTQKYDKISL